MYGRPRNFWQGCGRSEDPSVKQKTPVSRANRGVITINYFIRASFSLAFSTIELEG